MATHAPQPTPPVSRIRRPRVRKDLRRLSQHELNELRHAYEGLYAIGNAADDRGYEWIAGRHGYPGNYCHRDEADFWIWHRAYVYEFEERLRDAQVRATHHAPTVTLPYWDWTIFNPQTDAPNGIPKACNDPTYVDDDGQTKPNPLFSAFSIATNAQTVRDTTALKTNIPSLKSGVEGVLGTSDFITASNQLNFGPHGAVHVYVGGDMQSIRTSAFDPIFWLHHCNIDRLWWLWQARYGNTTVPAAQLSFVTAPFTYQGSQTLDAERFFGYTYRARVIAREAPEVRAALSARLSPPAAGASATAKGAPPPPLRVDLPGAGDKAIAGSLVFQGMAKTKESYEVRVFLNEDGPTTETSMAGNPHYAGTVWLFGHGECIGDLGHCDKPLERRDFDQRPPHHLSPHDLRMDVSAALKSVVDPAAPLRVTMVVLDSAGRAAAAPDFGFEGLALELDDSAPSARGAPSFRFG
ncbi:MAG TPA: tyrosinase family protein [Polyangiaceae bacterium]|nr:tyrosinase family protein [Polyangiaceae bacterium]